MMVKVLTRVVLPLMILMAAAATAGVMVLLAPDAERAAPPPRFALVETMTASPDTFRARVLGNGVVRSAKEVSIAPEVSGRVVWMSEKVRPGGRLAKGETLLRIDSRDYTLAERQEGARLRQTEVELQLELGRSGVARKEWQLLGDGRADDEAALALRAPQLALAEDNVTAAESGLARARLALERTSIRAPFNAMVVTEQVDEGQLVGPTSPVARLVGTDRFWVSVSVPVDRLPLLDLPSDGSDANSPATVRQELGDGNTILREATLVGLEGQLDPATRTATLLLAIEHPMDQPGLPLLPGAYVEATVQGKQLSGATVLPRSALYGGDHVWTVVDEALHRSPVTVSWSDATEVVVTEGLSDGDIVVTSPLGLPVDGMPVKLVGEDS
jgi:RND family efflux transporter MFP subunit